MLLDYLPLLKRRRQAGRPFNPPVIPTVQVIRGRAVSVLTIQNETTGYKAAIGRPVETVLFSSSVHGQADISDARRRDEMILAL